MSEIVKQDYSSVLTLGSNKSKAEIILLAKEIVQQELDDGFIKATEELAMATRAKAYFEARVDAMRPYAGDEMREDKSLNVLGAKLEKVNSGGTWTFNDNYLNELETEKKIVEQKAKLSDEKDRQHITLSGEVITISKAIKKEGGTTVKVTL